MLTTGLLITEEENHFIQMNPLVARVQKTCIGAFCCSVIVRKSLLGHIVCPCDEFVRFLLFIDLIDVTAATQEKSEVIDGSGTVNKLSRDHTWVEKRAIGELGQLGSYINHPQFDSQSSRGWPYPFRPFLELTSLTLFSLPISLAICAHSSRGACQETLCKGGVPRQGNPQDPRSDWLKHLLIVHPAVITLS